MRAGPVKGRMDRTGPDRLGRRGPSKRSTLVPPARRCQGGGSTGPISWVARPLALPPAAHPRLATLSLALLGVHCGLSRRPRTRSAQAAVSCLAVSRPEASHPVGAHDGLAPVASRQHVIERDARINPEARPSAVGRPIVADGWPIDRVEADLCLAGRARRVSPGPVSPVAQDCVSVIGLSLTCLQLCQDAMSRSRNLGDPFAAGRHHRRSRQGLAPEPPGRIGGHLDHLACERTVEDLKRTSGAGRRWLIASPSGAVLRGRRPILG